MIRGLYTSGWSMLALQKKMDVISNNMANSSTNGFKKDTVVFESFPDLLTKRIKDFNGGSRLPVDIGTMQLGYDVGEVYTYYSQGQLSSTNNSFDLAIEGSNSAFFTVAVPDADGNMRAFYTRNGSFTKNSDNMLVTTEGYAVLGENGPIILQDGEFEVTENGTIIQNNEVIDRLLITQFVDTSVLRKYGYNLIQAEEGAETVPFTGTIKQGFVELSNVNIVREMVDMITVLRSYEANQKILQAMDGTLDKAVNEVGRVR